MKHLPLLFSALSFCSIISAQTVDNSFRLASDSLSREACEFREAINSGHLPLVLSDKEKDLMNEILFYEQDSTERAERAAEIERSKEKNSGSKSGTSYSVGSIPLEQGVTPSGARTYSIPIPTAPGFKLVPSITLSYNSQAAEGWAGYGWDIQGISTISLINHNKYYHDTIRAASDTASSPVFALDGVPLVTNDNAATSAAYPLVTATGHILARTVLNPSGYVCKFEVLYPNGCRAVFGRNTYFSSHMAFYRIAEMEDMLGNRIVFIYANPDSSGNDRISSIRYGFDSAGNYSGEIVFTYTYTSGATQRYFAGKAIKHDYRLTSIETKVDGRLLSGYSFTYEQQDNVYLLSQVDYENASGEQLPPISFTYGTLPITQGLQRDPTGISLPDSLYRPDIIPYAYKRGKFFSNVFDDGVFIHLNYPYYRCHLLPIPSHPEWYHFESEVPANSNVLLIPRFANNSSYNTSIKAEEGFQTIEAVDVNGDGVDELVKVNLSIFQNLASTMLVLKVYKCNNNGGADTLYTRTPVLPGIVQQGFPNPYYMAYFWGDFRGNGRTMLLTIAYKDLPNFTGATQTCYASLIDIETGEVLSSDVLFDLMNGDEKTVLVCDIDSDGRAELCHASATGFDIFRLQASGHFALEKHLSYPGATTFTDNNRDFYVTDLNGDGYVDIVRTPIAGTSDNEWLYFKFDGSYFVQGGAHIITRQAGDRFMFMDVNRDGLADMIRISGTTLSTYINQDGTNFGAEQISSSSISDTNGIVLANVVTRKGTSAFIKFDGSTGFSYTFSPRSPKYRQINRLSDGFGKTFANSYVYLPSMSGSWTSSSYSPTTSSGYAKRALPLYVLCDEYTYEGDSGLPTIFLQHCYYDPVVHYQGLGFCGFHKLFSRRIHYFFVGSIARSNIKGSQTTLFDPEKRGVTTSISSVSGSGTIPFSVVTNTWDNHSTPYGKLAPRLLQTVSADSLHQVTTTTSYTYDSFDFPLTALTTKSHPGDVSQKEQHAWTYQHNNTATRYILGGVTMESVRRDLDGDWNRTWKEKSVYTLDTLLRPASRKNYSGISRSPASYFPYELQDSTLLVSETRWTYDSYGNVSSECSAPYNSTEFLGDTLVYDSAGRFLISRTDALGHTTTYSGYNKFGLPATATDYRGRTKSFTYDDWGNLVQTNYADGSVETVSRAWTGGAGSSGSGASVGRSLYAVTTSRTGKPSTIVHYDAFGREVHSGDLRFDWHWRWTDRQYDLEGRLVKVSLPYRTTLSTGDPAASLWNTYSYDNYDRATSIAEASGRTTTWSYSGTSTTTVKDGITSTSTTDASGNVVAVTDAGGTVTYTLRDDGQPSSVTAPGNVVTTFSYDGYGRKVGMVDPSVGTRTYSYTWNTDGSSSSSQTGPNGSITTSKDKYGRTTSVARAGEFSTTYSYDTYGKLTSETSTNGTSTTYMYDTLDRVTSIREDVPDGKWLKRDIWYGAGSNVSRVQYTSQGGFIAVQFYTYVNGHHIRTELQNGTLVFNLTSENNFGQPTGVSTQGVTRQYGFNSYGLPTSRKITVAGTTTTIQDCDYSFNAANGNLSSWADNRNATHGSYGYDSLNRLTTGISFDTNGGSRYAGYGYATNGNIYSLTTTGTVLYQDTANPYLATAVVPASGGGPVLLPKQSVAYNAYDRPTSISQNGITATLTYNGAEDRVKMAVIDSTGAAPATLLTRYYIGGRYEIDITPAGSGGGSVTTERFYLGGDAYSAPVVYVKGAGGANYWQAFNIGRDYLGSITQIATDSGTLVAEYSYEPWGRQRNPSTLAIYAAGSEPALFLGRGYTGHEYLPWFGLYNMNARLYDPLVGRFLAPDPFVQAPDFTQNFNRYSYCLNNPLKYTDPNGEFVFTTAVIVSLCVSSALGIGAGIWKGVKIADEKGLTGSQRAWTIVGGGLIGGVAGFAGGFAAAAVAPALAAAGIGGFSAGALTGAASGWAAGAINGFGMSLLGGKSIGQALGQMAIQGAIGALSGALIGGTIQGVSSSVKGNNFWTGKQPRQFVNHQNLPLADQGAKVNTEEIPEPQEIYDEYRIRSEAEEISSFKHSDLKPQLSVKHPEITGYNPRLDSQSDLFHNFPRLFDEIIVKTGAADYRINDGAGFYYLTGSINGKTGVYTIGINDDGIIFHRCFYPK